MDDKDIKDAIEGIEFKKKDEILMKILKSEEVNNEMIDKDFVNDSNELSSNMKEKKYVKFIKMAAGIAAGVAILFGVIFISGNKDSGKRNPAGDGQINGEVETTSNGSVIDVQGERFYVEIVACYRPIKEEDITRDEITTRKIEDKNNTTNSEGSLLVIKLDADGKRTNEMFFINAATYSLAYEETLNSGILGVEVLDNIWDLLSDMTARRKYSISLDFDGTVLESFPGQIYGGNITLYYYESELVDAVQAYEKALGDLDEIEFFNEKYDTSEKCNYVNGILSVAEKCIDSDSYNITLQKPNGNYHFCVSPDDFYNYDGSLVDIEDYIGKEILVEYTAYINPLDSNYQASRRMIICDTDSKGADVPKEVLLLEIEK